MKVHHKNLVKSSRDFHQQLHDYMIELKHSKAYRENDKTAKKEYQNLGKMNKILPNFYLKTLKGLEKIAASDLTEGKLTEKKETAIDVARRIVKNKQHEKGVDMQTANLIMKIYHAYDKNPSLQRKLEKMPLKKLAQGVWRFVK